MRKILYLLIVILFPSLVFSNTDTLFVKSEIVGVTVFSNGANIKRKASFKIPHQKGVIAFEGLPSEVVSESINLEGFKNGNILFIDSKLIEKTNFTKDKDVVAIQDEIDKINLDLSFLDNKIKSLAFEKQIIGNNMDFARRTKIPSIATIQNTTNYYCNRYNEIMDTTLIIKMQKIDLVDRMKELYEDYNRLYAERGKAKTTVYIGYENASEKDNSAVLTYFVPSAGWLPLYDFKVEDTDEPLKIVYKANVFQNTGEDWPEIKLILSTKNPTMNNSKPELETYYLGRARAHKYTKESNDGIAALQGKIMDMQTNEPIPFANIVVMRDGVNFGATTSDFDGNYTIKPIPPGKYDLQVTFVGYKTNITKGINFAANKIRFHDVLMSSTAEMLEVVEIVDYKVPLISKDETASGASIRFDDYNGSFRRNDRSVATTVGGVFSEDSQIGTVRGSRSDATKMYIDGVRVEGKPEIYLPTVSLEKFDFTTSSAYNISSNGSDNILIINTKEVDADFEYQTVPKLDDDIFIVANLTDWQDLQLLSGDANIYVAGKYIGTSGFFPNKLKDTLTLSLGRDDDISVSRKMIRHKNDRIFLGSNIKETLSWEIKVKNNKPHKVKLIVEDQFPISEKTSVEVELLETSGAIIDISTGLVKWELELEASESKSLILKYLVKYPKYSRVNVE